MRLMSLPRASNRCRGITLTGLLVGLSISLLVMATTTAVYALIARHAGEHLRHARLSQDLRAVIELIAQDVRRAGYWNRSALETPMDANCDGQTDVLDTWPTANPFQRSCRGIDLDLRALPSDGGTTADCLLYGYDADANGRVGFCASCVPQQRPFTEPPFDTRNSELFGFRLRQGSVQVRAGSLSTDRDFDCRGGRWEGLTSPDLRVTRLAFELLTESVDPQDPTRPCASGAVCQTQRQVLVELQGHLREDPSLRQTLATRIAIRNDRYVVQP